MNKMKIYNVIETVIGVFPMPKASGSDLMWNKGTSSIALEQEQLYLVLPEVAKDRQPLCNIRWKIFHKKVNAAHWNDLRAGTSFDEREPFPLGILNDKLLLSTNPAISIRRKRENGLESCYTRPELRLLDPDGTDKAKIFPTWDNEYQFFEHSYRGMAIDRESSTIFITQQAPYNTEQYGQAWCWIDSTGKTLKNGLFRFPQRGCYPVISLHNGGVAAFFDSDIVEPNEEHRKLKFAMTHNDWDYVFRNIYMFTTPDLRKEDFGECVKIASVEDYAGSIRVLDAWCAPDNSYFVLYHKISTYWPFIRDRFFPGKPIEISLELAQIRDGKVISTKSLIKSDDQLRPWSELDIKIQGRIGLPEIWTASSQPKWGRLWSPDGISLFLISAQYDCEKKQYKNYLQQILPVTGEPIAVPLKTPLVAFQMPSARNGCQSSGKVVMFGIADLKYDNSTVDCEEKDSKYKTGIARCVEFEISLEDKISATEKL